MAYSGALSRVRFFDCLPAALNPAAELRAGLMATAPTIAPKFFYDALGSRLFEAICQLPEYSLPRDEQALFERHLGEIGATIGTGVTLIDLGAGDCAKSERLFPLLAPAQYVAVDIAAEFLRAQLEPLAQRHERLDVIGVAADFTHALELPDVVRPESRLAFYPGSSIGNFAPAEAAEFLGRVRRLCVGGHLLIGADLVKPEREQVAAYDDALGVTAAFNLNVLNVANRIAGTNFEVADWRHVSLFNARESRIEMHLEARENVTVRWPEGERRFAAGERIHTENSYKYSTTRVTDLLRSVGYSSVRIYTDDAQRFALALARA